LGLRAWLGRAVVGPCPRTFRHGARHSNAAAMSEEKAGRGSGCKREKKKKGPKKEQLPGRLWNVRVGNPKMRNVKYTQNQDDILKQAVDMLCKERQKSDEELGLRQMGAPTTNAWSRIAYFAETMGLHSRSVSSLAQRYRRICARVFHGAWTPEQVEYIKDQCFAKPLSQIPWKMLGASIGKTDRQVRDKWMNMFGGGKKGEWQDEELELLRHVVTEATDDLAPVSHIPWMKVREMIPRRSKKQCQDRWYFRILPQLLKYESRNGIAIEDEVIERQILRNLKKAEFECVDLVNWQHINPFWPAYKSKRAYERMRSLVPMKFKDDEFYDEEIEWLYTAKKCEFYRKRDKRLLKKARLVVELEEFVGDPDDQAAESMNKDDPDGSGLELEERLEWAGARRKVRLWDALRLELVHSLTIPECPRAMSAAWDPNNMQLFVYGPMGAAHLQILEESEESTSKGSTASGTTAARRDCEDEEDLWSETPTPPKSPHRIRLVSS